MLGYIKHGKIAFAVIVYSYFSTNPKPLNSEDLLFNVEDPQQRQAQTFYYGEVEKCVIYHFTWLIL